MTSPALAFPLADADLCVKCGLCLPHCPTYRLTQDEGESPRGRIALMQAQATGLLQQSPKLETHLDHCLACRACEAVCPALVPYGRLIDAGRQQLAQQRPGRNRGVRRVAFMLTHRGPRRAIASLLRLYQKLGLQALLRGSRVLGTGRLARLESLLPVLDAASQWQPVYPSLGKFRGRVALFLGCVSDVVEVRALRDGVRVLTTLGYEVHVPKKQGCCGALHQHNGMNDEACRLADDNLQAFNGDYLAIVGTASGCTATLKEYNQLSNDPAVKPFTRRVMDIGSFLATCEWPPDVQLMPLKARVAVQDPCTLRNVLKTAPSIYSLLARIPGLEVSALPDNVQCCGSAGSYFLTEPEMADRLVAIKLENIRAMSPDMLVTSNVGCALHLAGALRRSGINLPVLHPVSVIARQMQAPPAVRAS